MTRSLSPLIFGLLLSLEGCISKVERCDLVGDYLATYSFGVEKLLLRSNGTYLQTVIPSGATAETDRSGTWEYDASREVVLVQDPLAFSDPFGKLNPSYKIPMKGTWNLAVRKTFNTITLNWNDDAGVKLEKQ